MNASDQQSAEDIIKELGCSRTLKGATTPKSTGITHRTAAGGGHLNLFSAEGGRGLRLAHGGCGGALPLLRRRAVGAIDLGRRESGGNGYVGPRGHGERPLAIVPLGAWQSARSTGDWTLIGCTVAPAFEFEGFQDGAPGLDAGKRLKIPEKKPAYAY